MCLAIPGLVVEVLDDANQLARVDVAGVKRTVNVGLLDVERLDELPGQWVLIHVGFALSKIDEREAIATLQPLQEMGGEYEQELRELKESVIQCRVGALMRSPQAPGDPRRSISPLRATATSDA